MEFIRRYLFKKGSLGSVVEKFWTDKCSGTCNVAITIQAISLNDFVFRRKLRK